MNATVTSTGNAGVVLRTPRACVCVDVFWNRGGFGRGAFRPLVEDPVPDCILVTHAHWDHFAPGRVARAAAARKAAVIGPAAVTRAVRGAVPEESLITIEPARGALATAAFPWGKVTCIGTRHGEVHNSYLIEADGWRLLHDGDNEDARLLDAAAIAPLDALFLCPWQGSAWEDCVARLAPRRWFLIHLEPEEIAAHRTGRFLPELTDHVPAAAPIIALAPGESYELAPAGERTPRQGDA